MPPKLKPRKYVLEGCSVTCSVNARNLPAGAPESIHRWYEQGANADQIVANCKSMGWEVSRGAAVRHKANHLIPAEHFTAADHPELVILDGEARAPTDLEILDRIVQAGAKQLAGQTIRISPEMTMKAMELRLRLTQGSVFDDFMAAVGNAFGAPDLPPPEAPEDPAAASSEDERAQAAVVDDRG